jgi:hypothetical protein
VENRASDEDRGLSGTGAERSEAADAAVWGRTVVRARCFVWSLELDQPETAGEVRDRLFVQQQGQRGGKA